MINILLGNTFRVSWRVLTNNEALSFKGRDISLILAAPSGKPMSVTPVVAPEDEDGATLTFVFQGSAQKEAGVYRLIIVENKAKESQALTDEIMAFRLVENRSDVTPDIPEIGGEIQVDVDTGNLKIGWCGDSAYESWLRVIRPERGADGEEDFIAWLRQPAEDAARYAKEQGDAAALAAGHMRITVNPVTGDIVQELDE